MIHELAQLEKLLERKKEYYLKTEKQNVKDAVQAEINIIENFIDAVQTKLIDDSEVSQQYIISLEKKLKQLEQLNLTLETICLMHGIDDWKVFLMAGSNFVLSELKLDRAQNCIRVPNQLRKFIYG